MARSSYLGRVAVGFDQFTNTIAGGDPDETLSARAWRLRDRKKQWMYLQLFIDRLFFWQVDHCEKAYQSELDQKHIASEYR